MKTVDAISAAIVSSGMTVREVSLAMGKSEGYISAALAQSKRKGGGVNSATLASVADTCGYFLVLVPEGELPEGAIAIDPPERGLEAHGRGA